jgi:hypothetical protein
MWGTLSVMQAYLSSALRASAFFFPDSSPNNHALATFQSRLAVSGEIFRTSAVSATLNPPK